MDDPGIVNRKSAERRHHDGVYLLENRLDRVDFHLTESLGAIGIDGI
jgi:hypothetical protein